MIGNEEISSKDWAGDIGNLKYLIKVSSLAERQGNATLAPCFDRVPLAAVRGVDGLRVFLSIIDAGNTETSAPVSTR